MQPEARSRSSEATGLKTEKQVVLVLRPALFWPVLVIVLDKKDKNASTTP